MCIISNSSETVTVGKMANAMEVTVVTDKTEREMATKLKDITAETMKTNVTAKTIVTTNKQLQW